MAVLHGAGCGAWNTDNADHVPLQPRTHMHINDMQQTQVHILICRERRRSRSPVRRRSRTPPRRRSRSPARRSRSPPRRSRSRSPRRRSYSPRRRSPSRSRTPPRRNRWGIKNPITILKHALVVAWAEARVPILWPWMLGRTRFCCSCDLQHVVWCSSQHLGFGSACAVPDMCVSDMARCACLVALT